MTPSATPQRLNVFRLAPLVMLFAACTPDELCAPAGNLCTPVGVLGSLGYNGDGKATESELFFPSSLGFDRSGRLVLADFNNMRIRTVDDGELVTTVGTGVHAFALEDAPSLDCPLENPVDVAFGPDGALYIAELHAGRVLSVGEDHRVRIVAGNTDIGFAGDGGPATEAVLSESWGVAVGDDGTVYIADTDNHVIRVVRPDGTIDTLAGVAGEPGFADGAPGQLDTPYRVRVDGERLLIADVNNNAIRALDPVTGELSTVLGRGETEGLLSGPYGVHPTGDGGFVVADSGNHVIRYVRADGSVQTVAGTGSAGRHRDGRDALSADLNTPADALPDGLGGLYIADMLNGAVRHVGGVLD